MVFLWFSYGLPMVYQRVITAVSRPATAAAAAPGDAGRAAGAAGATAAAGRAAAATGGAAAARRTSAGAETVGKHGFFHGTCGFCSGKKLDFRWANVEFVDFRLENLGFIKSHQ